MKSRKDILVHFISVVGQCDCLFKLIDGEDCFGEIELADNDLLRFFPLIDEVLQEHDYERYHDDDVLEFILLPLQDVDIDNLYYWSKEKYCFINLRWSFDQESWLHDETKPGSIPLPKYFSEPIKDSKRLRRVGYWQSDQWQPYFPHPKYLVEPGWRESERSMILAYLKSGHECGHWCGYSYCRFDCFLQLPEKGASELARREFTEGLLSMGCRDLTDGEWIWPEGLAHYIEKHNVCLPDEFIETMQRNSWLVPAEISSTDIFRIGINWLYWSKWAIDYVQSKESQSKA